jgi:hypothetical protein
MIRRGGERGIRRKKAQTPYEYAQSLETLVPEVDQDIHSLTDAFVDARYSRKEVNDKDANVVKRSWQKIRGALRTFRK